MSSETFKGLAHFAVGGAAAAFTLYNLMRFAESRERHSLVNVCAYGLLFGLEWHNTKHHLTKP